MEFYVKTGIVLLGATFPISLIVSAGGVALTQSAIISIVTAAIIFFVATRVFGLDRRFAAVLGTGRLGLRCVRVAGCCRLGRRAQG